MRSKFLETTRDDRITPRRELSYLASFFGVLLVMVLACEFLARNEAEYLRIQSKIVYAFFLILAGRLFTFRSWGEHYKETIKLILGYSRFDEYSRVSVVSVFFDIFMVLVLLFWVKIDKVSFVRLPFAGLVYVLLIGFSMLKKKRTVLVRS